jgi:pimeloyl-ACP methyl ester carboxylesterase
MVADDQAPANSHPELSPFSALASPVKLAAEVTPMPPFIYIPGRFLFGAYALQQYECQNVDAEGHRARFTPSWNTGSSAGPGDPAFALYTFNMEYFDGDGRFVLNWEGQPPVAGDVYIGLGNIDDDRWDWFPAPPGADVVVDNLGPYKDMRPYLTLAVVLLGEQEALLDSVQIGERWIYEGVDMSMLLAPVLDFEVDAVRDDWAGRNPVAQDYAYLGEEMEGNIRWVLMSHTVDGLTHYGLVRIPPVYGDDKLPVLVMCHPGAGGIAPLGVQWFDNTLDDPLLRRSFIFVMPSFRAEQCLTETLGDYWSEGTYNLYDRDADDAIAMLDCVLTEFPEADPELVLAVGHSRGAQVAVRMAQRDTRIDGVITFAGWTDEWLASGQASAYYLLPELDTEPTTDQVQYLYNHALWELREGLRDEWQMRNVMLRMSTAYFADSLPRIQIHHGAQDGLPVDHAERLMDMLWDAGHVDAQLFIYPQAGHLVESFEGVETPVSDFLRSFLGE